MVKGNAGPGIYSATYSNIPVYEFQFGPDLKEHVMRRRHDNWINATHILKAAGFDKPARTRILEREVQKETHEKVQGGYGKYQGTWVPLASGQALAHRNGVYDKLSTIFEFIPGNDSPPPAPKHTTNKPKAPKKPAVPKFHNTPAPRHHSPEQVMYDNVSQLNDDETPDNVTVASASYFEEEDRDYDMSQPPTGHRKRKFDHDQAPRTIQEQTHLVYADELLDYFLISQADEPAMRPEPPLNFLPEFPIDNENNTALHWACAMGDVDIMKELRRFGADIGARNIRGETPLMRAVFFTNCQDKQSMPRILQELIDTVGLVDNFNATAIHHASAMTSSRSKHHCARYYIDVILNSVSDMLDQDEIRRILDIQDTEGNTACHLAAKYKARKVVRALIGRGASTDIRNQEGITAEELIQELNSNRRERNLAASSSPFAPDSNRRMNFNDPPLDPAISRHTTAHHSEAAMTVESKVTPLINEKFQHLAQSFDEELVELDRSEKEAKRILNQTHLELAQTSDKITALQGQEENDDQRMQEENELARLKANVISLVEQQQQLLLSSQLLSQEQMSNGHMNGMHDEGVEVKLEVFKKMEEEKERRRQLVEDYTEGLAGRGMGEKGELYRRLTAKVLGMTEEEVDGQLESLLAALEDGGKAALGAENGEAVMVD